MIGWITIVKGVRFSFAGGETQMWRQQQYVSNGAARMLMAHGQTNEWQQVHAKQRSARRDVSSVGGRTRKLARWSTCRSEGYWLDVDTGRVASSACTSCLVDLLSSSVAHRDKRPEARLFLTYYYRSRVFLRFESVMTADDVGSVFCTNTRQHAAHWSPTNCSIMPAIIAGRAMIISMSVRRVCWSALSTACNQSLDHSAASRPH